MCQRPKRASFISTVISGTLIEKPHSLCQRPKRASFISTTGVISEFLTAAGCVNALNGLLSFLRRLCLRQLFWSRQGCQRPKRASFISTGVSDLWFETK